MHMRFEGSDLGNWEHNVGELKLERYTLSYMYGEYSSDLVDSSCSDRIYVPIAFLFPHNFFFLIFKYNAGYSRANGHVRGIPA